MTYIAWVDIETTSLDLSQGKMLEFALIVTDEDLIEHASYATIINPEDNSLNDPDHSCWNEAAYKLHQKTGLLSEMQQRMEQNPQPPTIDAVEANACERLDLFEMEEPPILGGSTVHFDRTFLHKYMPDFHSRLHYRNLDVSTLRFLAGAWGYGKMPRSEEKPHRADDDIRNSIQELKFYYENMFKEVPSQAVLELDEQPSNT